MGKQIDKPALTLPSKLTSRTISGVKQPAESLSPSLECLNVCRAANLPNLIDGVTQAQFENILREFLQNRNIEDFSNVFNALKFQYTYWPVVRNATYTRHKLMEVSAV